MIIKYTLFCIKRGYLVKPVNYKVSNSKDTTLNSFFKYLVVSIDLIILEVHTINKRNWTRQDHSLTNIDSSASASGLTEHTQNTHKTDQTLVQKKNGNMCFYSYTKVLIITLFLILGIRKSNNWFFRNFVTLAPNQRKPFTCCF